MPLVSIESRDPTPIYAQLDRGLRAAIATGRLQLGDQLPTVRQLAVDLKVNATTVARVYMELERAGVIARRRLPVPSASVVYELTAWGRDLEPIIWAIARWGVRRLAIATPLHPLRASWLATALQAFFRKEAVRRGDLDDKRFGGHYEVLLRISSAFFFTSSMSPCM